MFAQVCRERNDFEVKLNSLEHQNRELYSLIKSGEERYPGTNLGSSYPLSPSQEVIVTASQTYNKLPSPVD